MYISNIYIYIYIYIYINFMYNNVNIYLINYISNAVIITYNL